MTGQTWLFRAAGPLVFLIVFCCVAPLYWISIHAPVPSVYHDDAVYSLTAKALAEGQGYRIISAPHAPAQTKYPILFPFLLSILWRIDPQFPHNLALLRGLPLLCGALWVAGAWWFVKESTGHSLAAWLAASILVASPWTMFVSTLVMSDTLFAVLCIAALLALRRAERQDHKSWTVYAALLSAAAFHTRSIGIVLIGAGVIGLLCRRRFIQSLLFGAISVGSAIPWIAWQWINNRNADPYLSHVNYYQVSNLLFSYSWSEKVHVAFLNVCIMLQTPLMLAGSLPTQTFAECLLCLIVTATVLVGLARRGMDMTARLFAGLTVCLLIIWVFPAQRFLVPLLPVLLVALWNGIPKNCRLAAFTAFCLGIVGVEAPELMSFAESMRVQGYAYPWTRQEMPDIGARLRAERQLAWVREHVPMDALIFTYNDPVVYLSTGRKAIRGIAPDLAMEYYSRDPHRQPFGSPEALLSHISRVRADYIMCSSFPPNDEAQHLNQLIHLAVSLRPEAFKRISESDPGLEIYRVFRDRL